MEQYIYIISVTLTWIAIALATIHVVMDNRQPAKTMAWVLVIFFVPVIGVILYLFFGVNHRKEKLISQRSIDQLTKHSMLSFVEQQDLKIDEQFMPMVDLFINQNFLLPFKNNTVDILTSGYEFFPRLLRDIAQARHHIHIDMYIIENDALGRLVADALIARVKDGIQVRIIYDDVGCWKVSRSFIEYLRMGGVETVPFLPVHFPSFTSKANYRNHRKLVIIDGKVGYIGGMNIAERYVKGLPGLPWRDTMLRFTGGIVYALQRTFLTDWYFVDRTLITDRVYYPPLDSTLQENNCLAQVVTSGPVTPYPEIMQGFVYAITMAHRYIYIETPYFMPTEPVLFALKTAAIAGVEVVLLIPYHSDSRFTAWSSRSYLRELHEAGAHVYLYEGGFLHSKLMIIDDMLSTCGSTNVDFRSFENNFEANVFIYDETTARRLKEVFLNDRAQSTSLNNMVEWVQPNFVHRLWESLVRLLSPLL